MIDKHNSKLFPLSPKSDLSDEKYKRYETYLNDVLENNSINNIAITGKYGSGKSSIVDTYFDKNKSEDYLRVSFATFNTKKKDKETDSDSQNDKNESRSSGDANELKTNIAANIINQIIYQIDSSRIPLTNFKIKSELKITVKSLFIIEVMLILSFFSPKNISNYFSSNLMLFFIAARVLLIMVITSVIIWHLLSRVNPSKFKLVFKNIETDIDTTNDDLFEKHIDEIIYLFNKSGKSILIIEDLDRFNNLEIFEKLRELNIKLNSNKNIQWKFIYLIKDELFKSESDRVKFFDIIIPVIPFITTNNSYYKLRELFPENDTRLLNILSVYIDDYRLLLNIRNEYTIFLPNSLESEQNELLALISYKNLYPDKFDDLQNGKGELADIICKFIDNIDEQIDIVTKKIEDLKLKKDKILADNEVDYLVLWAIKNNLQYTANYTTHGVITDINVAKNIIRQLSNWYVRYNNNNITYTNFKAQNKDYLEGLKVVVSFDAELKDLKSQQVELSLNRNKLYFIDENLFEQLSDDILVVLIKNKFITENYLDVINHYYGDISNRTFLQSLLSYNNNVQTDLKLTNISDLTRRLQEEDYNKKQILNFDLLEYMFEKNKQLFQTMVLTANREEPGFIEKVLNRDSQYYDSIIQICPEIHFELSELNLSNDTIFNDIVEENRYDESNVNFDILKSNMERFSLEKLLSLINNTKLYSSIRKNIVSNILSVVNLNDITDKDLWKTALNGGKIKPTVENVMVYFNKSGKQINETLTNFLNNQKIVFETDLSEKFYNVLLSTANKNLKNEKFEEIIKQCKGKNISTELVQNQSKDKLQILLNNNMLEMSSSTIKFIMDHGLNVPNKLIDDKFIQIVVNDKLDINKVILDEIISTHNENGLLILSRNLKLLSKEEVLSFLKNLNKDGKRLIKVLKNENGFLHMKFDDTEEINNVLNWAKEQQFISGYTKSNNKITINK